MKRTAAFALALILLITAPVLALADPLTEGFDPETVVAGMLENVNAGVSNSFTAEAADTEGLYNVYFQGAFMGGYLCINHVDETGVAADGEKNNHIVFADAFAYNEDTAASYLDFWLAISSGLVQYATGTAFDTASGELFSGLSAAVSADEHIYKYASAGYDIELTVNSGNGMLLISTEITAPGLY